MEEQPGTLLDSLKSFGVSIPNDATSMADLLFPEALVSICAQCLNLIDDSLAFPTLPDSTAENFKVCTDIAGSIKGMGFAGDLSFYEFLYPSEEDTSKLMRFLVERLSETSAVGKAADSGQGDGENLSNSQFEQRLWLKGEVPESASADLKDSDDKSSEKAQSATPANIMRNETQDCRKDRFEVVKKGNDSIDESEEAKAVASGNLINPSDKQCHKMKCSVEEMRHRRKRIEEALKERTSELQHLNKELELLKAAAEMALNEDHPGDFFIETHNGDIDAKKKNLIELESQGNALRMTLEEKKRGLEESIYGSKPDLYAKFRNLKEVERETDSILSETQTRKGEYSWLLAELKKQPRQESRRSYINRMNEITKNSRKQDADIERILRDTRELQLESNSIQERLHRTYAVTDETVFREAKKDQVGRQAYRLLTSIHETFEQITEKILATDRVQRERAEHEKKLAGMATGSSNISKLEANLETIVKENEYLEQRLQHNQN
ncbi:coiled-coil domain-containing protein 22 isoform X1 [Punica granatum]|uniref:Coiled-coil domain-containing protein 22 isoform X1 n=2 Tax=Punica granatum TaxID=22663 RepID=A0A6P8BYU7_PUNGR|nr:coiled-coil domain-containing protein 22 isoform X1 [Punica granatum]